MEIDIMQIIYGVLGGALMAALCCLLSPRLAGLMQQSGYRGRRFLQWYFRKGNIQRKRISLLALSLVLLTALFDLCFCFLSPVSWANLLSAAPVVAVGALYLVSEKKYALKVPENHTPRFVRLLACHGALFFALSVGAGVGLAFASLAVGKTWFTLLRFVPLAALPLVLPFTLACANALMCVYEIPHNRRFVKQAGRALAGSSCKKVGITGSFGKTSVKHYAAQLLSSKYRVVATPASYNTPMGIARTVKEQGLGCDIFLAEMGARHRGDIRELCELVRPEYGVVTGICPQHIQTFGSLEAIAEEKGELASFAKKCVLGATFGQREGALCEGKDFAAEDVALSPEGTSFVLRLFDDRKKIRTKLLGRHAAEDVALAAALCSLLGMTLDEIALAAADLAPVPHRLEKLEQNGLVILDDSYNSNIEGAKNAVETLLLFEGRHYVVTPGLVELGQLEEALNEELGAALAGTTVILVGETLVLPVKKGYLDAGGKDIRVVPTLKAAQKILSEELAAGDCVLFLNDLPDLIA